MHDDLVKDVLARFAGRDYRPDGPPVWAWHVHHDILGEPLSAPIIARVQAIIDTKPSHEVVARLRALRPVLGVLPSAYVEAWKAYAEAGKAYAEAGRVYVEAWKAYAQELSVIHDGECSECPWDGETMVFGTD